MRADPQQKIGFRHFQGGFTLVEMIVVMAITGILGGMIAVLIRGPVQGYVDSARRAEMADIADTAAHRLLRDIRMAVPNSVRLPAPAGSAYIEFLPTKTGGRYRADPDLNASGVGQCGGTLAQDILDFTVADTCFEILGPPINFSVGDQIVVGSMRSDGNAPYDVPTAASSVRRDYNGALGVGVQRAVITSTVVLPAASPRSRFEVVSGEQQAVTYACENSGVATGGDGAGTLKRYWKYGFAPEQAAPAVIAASAVSGAASSSLLADKISSCNIVYDAVKQLVSITLRITRSGESLSLYQEIHVDNAP